MYKHILVAIAFHDETEHERVIQAAMVLANDSAHVTVLHVREAIPSSSMAYLPADYMAELRAEIQERLDVLAARFKDGVGVIVDGHAGRTIVDWADENDVDCIVMASHLLGNTAGRVVRHAPCSVHVVR
jgi:nucleotide-binding universal stress UspA family protein